MIKISMVVVLLVGLCLSRAPADTTPVLNNLGLEEYKQGKYGEAIQLFRKSIDQNPRNVLAHHNLACSANLWNDRDYESSDAGLIKEAITHLKISIELNPNRKGRILKDPDLRTLHRTVFFRLLKESINLHSTSDVKSLLVTTNWTSDIDCGGGLQDDSLTFSKVGKVYAGCRHPFESEQEEYLIADDYQVNGPNIVLIRPTGEIKSMRVEFDGIEAHVKGGREWHEYSGYHASP